MIRFNDVDFVEERSMEQKLIRADVTGRSISGVGFRDIIFNNRDEYIIDFNQMTEAKFNELRTVINTPEVKVECTTIGHAFVFNSAQVFLRGNITHGYSGMRLGVSITVTEN